jgi:steroid 5-alpha reductase family enzyme
MNKGNEPAFACNQFDFLRMKDFHYGRDYDQYTKTFGLTKREYFAGLAMQGIVAHFMSLPISMNEVDKETENICAWSIKIADTLVDKLNP